MMASQTQKIIEKFYKYYNASELEQLFSLIDDNIIHEVNHARTHGKDKFITYIMMNKKNYNEHIDDYILMISADGRYATTKFIVKGTYINADDSSLPARQQCYELQVIIILKLKTIK